MRQICLRRTSGLCCGDRTSIFLPTSAPAAARCPLLYWYPHGAKHGGGIGPSDEDAVIRGFCSHRTWRYLFAVDPLVRQLPKRLREPAHEILAGRLSRSTRLDGLAGHLDRHHGHSYLPGATRVPRVFMPSMMGGPSSWARRHGLCPAASGGCSCPSSREIDSTTVDAPH